MKLDLQPEAVLGVGLDQSVVVSSEASFASWKQSAALEFHASLQLLAERARCLTGAAGVAVAIKEAEKFVYTAAAGSLVPEIGTNADVTKLRPEIPQRGACSPDGARETAVAPQPLHSGTFDASIDRLEVPILRDDRVVGFFELAPGTAAFDGADVEAASRLAAMAVTALDHLEAAQESARLIHEAQPGEPHAPSAPLFWHAPEGVASQPAAANASRTRIPADVHDCAVCGFPVSGVRRVCVDCETQGKAAKPNSKIDSSPGVELFATGREENWFSSHGYTIASLLVTALAAAVLYWLR